MLRHRRLCADCDSRENVVVGEREWSGGRSCGGGVGWGSSSGRLASGAGFEGVWQRAQVGRLLLNE